MIIYLIESGSTLEDSEEAVVPTMSDTIIPRRPIVPLVTPNKNGHANNGPQGTSRPKPVSPVPIQTTTTTQRTTTSTSNPHNVILAAHPQDNEIAGSVNHRFVNITHCKIV